VSAAPEWARANYIHKLGHAYAVLEKMGGLIFTLRLRRDMHDKFVAAADPCRAVYKRIDRSFARFGVNVQHYAYFLEVTRDDRNDLHLHGALSLGNSSRELARTALSYAGGKMTGPAAARQVDFMNFDGERGGPFGWARSAKAVTRTRGVIQHARVTYISAPLRNLARDEYELKRRSRPD
jgi:hypothetical protein